VDGARVVAYSCELLRLRIVGVGRVENGVGGPYADVSIWQQLVSTVFRGGALRMSSHGGGQTYLRLPSPDAIHRAKRDSCRLQSL
jgi:hypothetical protein